MIDPNTKTDYNKMKKLLQLDKLDGNRKGVILEITEKGKIISNLETTFPAETLTNPNMFVSLLFYYGMLTIKGTRGSRLILGIPNNNVRKQYYEYLLEQYEEKASLDTNQLEDYFMIWPTMASGMTLCSSWQIRTPRYLPFVTASRRSEIYKVSSWRTST